MGSVYWGDDGWCDKSLLKVLIKCLGVMFLRGNGTCLRCSHVKMLRAKWLGDARVFMFWGSKVWVMWGADGCCTGLRVCM